jgi:hypothetical protein
MLFSSGDRDVYPILVNPEMDGISDLNLPLSSTFTAGKTKTGTAVQHEDSRCCLNFVEMTLYFLTSFGHSSANHFTFFGVSLRCLFAKDTAHQKKQPDSTQGQSAAKALILLHQESPKRQN